jgi:hypothetical protein
MVTLAWLIKNRADVIIGPIESDPTVAWIANRLVVEWLGGSSSDLETGQVYKNNLKDIWHDPILNHAFTLGGEVPTIQYQIANDKVPDALLHYLKRMTSRS